MWWWSSATCSWPVRRPPPRGPRAAGPIPPRTIRCPTAIRSPPPAVERGMISPGALLLLASPLLAAGPQASSPRPEVESYDLPPLRVYLVREPPRLSFHFADKLLVAQTPGRERGSMEFLLDSGWHAARSVSALRELSGPGDGKAAGGAKGLAVDLVLEGGLAAALQIERGEDGDLRLEVSGPPGTLAARDGLLRYHAETLLGVEGVRWHEPNGPPGPEDDLVAAQEGPRFFLSSRGY